MDLAARLQQELPPLPRWLGITVTSAEPDRVVAELTVREELCTAGEIIHGGAIMAFADTIGALGTVDEPARRTGHDDTGEQDEFLRGAPGREHG